MPTIIPPGMPDDGGALEGPDVEVPTSAPAGLTADGVETGSHDESEGDIRKG